MFHLLTAAVVLAAFPAFAVVVPAGLDTAEGPNNNGYPFNCGAFGIVAVGQRYQQVYAGPEVGSGRITELRFRQDALVGVSFGPTMLAGVSVSLSSTTATPSTLSSTFASNVGSDVAVVFSGNLTISSAPSGLTPRPFDILVPIASPFYFGAGSGPNLLLDITIPTCAVTSQLDAQDMPGDSVARVFSTESGPGTAVADESDTAGIATQLTLATPVCSNGFPEGAEQCDDANAASGDGCSATCTVETGFTCSGVPSVCLPLCGDGLILGGEQCDDANGLAGDGCAGCVVESGWICSGTPSVCVPLCGDGVMLGGEQCDDGNVSAGDCCSPACLFDPAATACTADTNACTDDVCDGAGACAHPHNAVACDDGDLCTIDDMCAGGACAGNFVVCPTCEACDPGTGSCAAAPQPFCKVPTESFRAKLVLKQDPGDRGDAITWKWLRGEQVDVSELGTPQTSDDYELCVFDATPAVLVAATAPGGGTCGRNACWKRLGNRGVKYSDPELTPAGLLRIVAKAGDPGKAKATVVGRGPDLQDPALPVTAFPIVVQLRNVVGTCWEASYYPAGVVENGGGRFVGQASLEGELPP